jgi:AcrR family transcriptional regulator
LFTEQQEKWLQRVEDMFFRLGIKSVTMDDVAQELGISKKTLYQFVENKDDLVSKVMDRHLQEQCRADEHLHTQASNAIDEMVRVFRHIMSDMQQMKPNIIRDLQKYHRETWEKIQHFQRDYIFTLVLQNLEWGKREGLYRGNLNLEVTAKLYIATSFVIFDDFFFPKPPYSFDQLFKEHIINHLYNIVSDKGRVLLETKLSA